MTLFRHAPLRQKLISLTMICSVVALTTTAVALGTYEWFFYRKTMYAQLETMGSMTARNSAAALAFVDAVDAHRVLGALEEEPSIVAAALYDAAGARIAVYRAAGEADEPPAAAPPDGQRAVGGRLDIVLPVREGKRFGTLLLRADISAIGARLAAYGLVLLSTMAMSGLLAFLLTGWLSRRIVAPVQALVQAASSVQTNADYSIRVPKAEEDELGALTDAFNGMLARVQQNEAELYRGNERLRLAIEAGGIGTWDWNLVRNEIVWNERNYRIFGLDPATPPTAEVFFGLVHPEDRARVTAAVEAASRTSADFSVEFRLAQSEGPARYVAARGLFLKSSAGDALRAVGVTVDITERRGAELRILESETRFRAVAERAPALIWSCDLGLARDYFNKTWLTFTGRALEDELGRGWQAGMPGADAARWDAMVGAAAHEHDPYSIEYRLRRADGALRWIVETGSPRLAADGTFAGYLGSCIDITARKNNEAELEAHVRLRTRELEVANQELETFSYSVSHDLRGPVRAIQGFAEIAIEECQANNPAAAIERLARVVKAAERMNKLIDAFISMARISRAELDIEPVDLSRMAEEIVAFLRSTDPARAVQIAIEPGLVVQGDERLLRIAMENLIGNAWKFSAKTAEARIEFGAEEQDGARVFHLRDNGAGFDRALAHKLFQAFERLHRSSQFEGLGVGLSTVHRVIDKHGGRIWAEGEEGKGAQFFFTLPARPATNSHVNAA